MSNLSRPPLIGLTTYSPNQIGKYYIPGLYVEAVYQAGGIPLLLPPVPTAPAMLEPLDGLVLIGGGDIEPSLYNGTPHPSIYNVDPQRDAFEIALIESALLRQLPLLGICRGLEIIVVAGGGDLVPHVPEHYGERVIHRSTEPEPAQHPVQILPSSQLAQVMGTTDTTVVSIHHQATKTLPPEWRAVAWADDGLIEAIEHEQHPFALAVQWHPELSLNDAAHLRLFQALVATAARTPSLLAV